MQQKSMFKGRNNATATGTDNRNSLGTKFMRKAQSVGITSPKPTPLKSYGKEINNGIIRLERLKYVDMMPEVDRLVKAKSDVINEVSTGKRIVTNDDMPQLRPLFTQKEAQSLISYSASRKSEVNRYALFNAMFRNVTTGELLDSDIPEIRSTFGDTIAAKMIIVYNDRMLEEGKPKSMLPEDKKTKKLRSKISKLINDKKEVRHMIRLLGRLKSHKFTNEKEFTEEFNKIGLFASHWLSNMDWRDRPFLIQYAVGKNERIKNPYNGGKYYINFDDPRAFESGMEKHTKELKKEIRNIGEEIRLTQAY